MNRKYKLFVLSSLCSLYSCSELYSQEPCNSGPQTGQRCGPYAALIATGPERGQSYCYICETGDKPAVLIFPQRRSVEPGCEVGEVEPEVCDSRRAFGHF